MLQQVQRVESGKRLPATGRPVCPGVAGALFRRDRSDRSPFSTCCTVVELGLRQTNPSTLPWPRSRAGHKPPMTRPRSKVAGGRTLDSRAPMQGVSPSPRTEQATRNDSADKPARPSHEAIPLVQTAAGARTSPPCPTPHQAVRRWSRHLPTALACLAAHNQLDRAGPVASTTTNTIPRGSLPIGPSCISFDLPLSPPSPPSL